LSISNTIFTIGHSTYKVDKFVSILQTFQIDTIVDVRSIPYSKFASNYNKENIQAFLIKNNFNYIYMGDLLGGKNISDIEARWASEDFLKGINRLQKGMEQNYKIALMCGEKDPQDCHRSRLLGEYLTMQDVNVFHIIDSDKNTFKKILHQKKIAIKQKTLF